MVGAHFLMPAGELQCCTASEHGLREGKGKHKRKQQTCCDMRQGLLPNACRLLHSQCDRPAVASGG